MFRTSTVSHENTLSEMPYFPQFRTSKIQPTDDASGRREPVAALRRPDLMNDAFHRDGGGFAATDAERGNAAFQVLRFQRVQQRHDQPRAGGADGMAERTGAAVDRSE